MGNVFAMGKAFRSIALRQFIISDAPLIRIPLRATSDMPKLFSLDQVFGAISRPRFAIF
jgi:hypothetical protein